MKIPGPQAFFKRLLHYATRKVGRVQAYQRFMGASAPASEAEPEAKIPLGERLHFKHVNIDDVQVRERARKKMGKGYRAPAAPFEVIYKFLMASVRHVAPAYGLSPKDIVDQRLFGKDGRGWVSIPGTSVKFDVGKKAWWRITDWLRPKVLPAKSVELAKLTLLKTTKALGSMKEELGDGVFAVVKPETVGLPPGTVDFFQARACLRRDNGTIFRLFKGLVVVHPGAHDVLAWEDGYGKNREEGVLDIYEMFRGSDANFRSRYTIQGLYFQGIRRWWRKMFTLDNLRLHVQDDTRMLEDKLIAADAPVRALGGFGLIAVVTRVLSLAVASGVSRMALPAKAFAYIDGLEYLAEIEDAPAEGEGESGVPWYYAPEPLRRYYRAFGTTPYRALNRRPDLATGQCVKRFKLKGFQPFNAIVVPSWALTISGLDFDGDAIVDFPVEEQGGLYRCFNDLPLWLQQFVLAASHTEDRKEITLDDGRIIKLKDLQYESPAHRWAGQLEAKDALGSSDMDSRRAIDKASMAIYDRLATMGERPDLEGLDPVTVMQKLQGELSVEEYRALEHLVHAFGNVAWTQCTVDRQKRPVPYPNPEGLQEMPKVVKTELDKFACDELKKLMKGVVPESDDKVAYHKAWDRFSGKLVALADLADASSPDYPFMLWVPDPDMREAMLGWALTLYVKVRKLARQFPNVGDSGRPAPHEVRYPNREEARKDPPRDATLNPLVHTAVMLDHYWERVVSARGRDEMKLGLFNLKDGLLDAARERKAESTLADYCHNYALFREFASIEQLKAYFASLPGERVSDHFALVSERDFKRRVHKRTLTELTTVNGRVEAQEREYVHAVHYTNTVPMYVGFERFKLGEVEFTRKTDVPGTFARAGSLQLWTPAVTMSDAMLYLKDALSGTLPELEALRTQLLPSLPKAAAAPTPVPAETGDAEEDLVAQMKAHSSAAKRATPTRSAPSTEVADLAAQMKAQASA